MAAVAAIGLDTLDLTALEPGAQSTCLETMARLLCSVDVPLQLLVRRRRFPAPGPPSSAPPSPIAADLDAAVRSHRTAALAAVPAFRSDVVVVLCSADGDAAVLQRQAGLALEALRAAGLRPRTLAAAPPPAQRAQTSACAPLPSRMRSAAAWNWSGCRDGR